MEGSSMSKAINQHHPRIQFDDDQLLAAQDLQDDRCHADWLRRLHLRVLHDTWGIALGFNVFVRATHLFVTPGLAYDGWGREIVLIDTLEIPIPQGIGTERLVLSVQYPETLDIGQPSCNTSVPCDGQNPAQERPTFKWQSPMQLRLGVEIPLVLIRLNNNQLDLDFSTRRYAQTLQRPHIGWDTTHFKIANEQELVPYLWKLPGIDNPIGFQFQIDTAAAGFVHTPLYFANLKVTINIPEADLLLNARFKSIDNPATDHFNFRILFLPNSTFGAARGAVRLMTTARQDSEALQISISWIGIEPVTGGEPDPTQKRILSWNGTQLLDWQIRELSQGIESTSNSLYSFGGEP
jgi:hypothetical protein